GETTDRANSGDDALGYYPGKKVRYDRSAVSFRDPQSAIRNSIVIRIIYNLLWPLGLVFFLPGYFLKMFRRGGYREKFIQRTDISTSRPCLRARARGRRSMAAARRRARPDSSHRQHQIRSG